MSTSWTLIASQVCRDALGHLSVIGSGETISADDQAVALRALDAVLKGLPLSGYVWPKLSGETPLVWSSGTPQTVSLPADYYDFPRVWKTVNGDTVPLIQIPHAAWIAMAGRTQTAPQPTHFYISPSKVLFFWPVPTQDPVATLQYQKIIDDASATASPDVLQVWLNPLAWGVADELSLKFGLPGQERAEIKARWEEKKRMALESLQPFEPIAFSVAD